MRKSNPDHESRRVTVVGAGLAGSEAAWQLAEAGVKVRLFEMRPSRLTEAHRTGHAAELVCSNTFKSVEKTAAHGLLKEEVKSLGGFLFPIAEKHRVPAGSALAVDRGAFAEEVTSRLRSHPGIEWVEQEVKEIPGGSLVLLAVGPLAGQSLVQDLLRKIGRDEDLYFYDAIAPIVAADSLLPEFLFQASRYGKDETGIGDYLNAPLSQEQYEAFVRALLEGEKVEARDFEKLRYFEGCMPIEGMAERGADTLRFGPMKPVGLTDPKTGRRPYAVVQLRRENERGDAWNLVGFQTRLKYPEQQRIFRMIPALSEAEFIRLGSIHRNTFVNSPSVLSADLSLKAAPLVFLAGQITGVEGYSESVACGMMAAKSILARLSGKAFVPPPPSTALGALLGYLRNGAASGTFQPTNINFSLLDSLPEEGGFSLENLGRRGKKARLSRAEKRMRMADRALEDLRRWEVEFLKDTQ